MKASLLGATAGLFLTSLVPGSQGHTQTKNNNSTGVEKFGVVAHFNVDVGFTPGTVTSNGSVVGYERLKDQDCTGYDIFSASDGKHKATLDLGEGRYAASPLVFTSDGSRAAVLTTDQKYESPDDKEMKRMLYKLMQQVSGAKGDEIKAPPAPVYRLERFDGTGKRLDDDKNTLRSYPNHLTCSPDDQRWAYSSDQEVIVTDQKGNTAFDFKTNDYVTAIAFSPDSKTIVYGDHEGGISSASLDGTPAGEPKTIHPVKGNGAIKELSVSSHGQIAFIMDDPKHDPDNITGVLDPSSPQPTVWTAKGFFHDVVVSPDGNTAVVRSISNRGERLEARRMDSGDIRWDISGGGSGSETFSPDGKTIYFNHYGPEAVDAKTGDVLSHKDMTICYETTPGVTPNGKGVFAKEGSSTEKGKIIVIGPTKK